MNVLPNSLTHITFGHCYNQKIDKFVLPNSLKYIRFGLFYNQKIIRDILPNSLECVMIGINSHDGDNGDIIPDKLVDILRNYDAFYNLNNDCEIYLYNTFEDEYNFSNHFNKQRLLYKSLPLPIFDEINHNIDGFDY